MNPDRSCWACDLQKIGGWASLLGECRWFSVNRGQPDKLITPAVVDVGCKFWTPRQAKAQRIDFDGGNEGAAE